MWKASVFIGTRSWCESPWTMSSHLWPCVRARI